MWKRHWVHVRFVFRHFRHPNNKFMSENVYVAVLFISIIFRSPDGTWVLMRKTSTTLFASWKTGPPRNRCKSTQLVELRRFRAKNIIFMFVFQDLFFFGHIFSQIFSVFTQQSLLVYCWFVTNKPTIIVGLYFPVLVYFYKPTREN